MLLLSKARSYLNSESCGTAKELDLKLGGWGSNVTLVTGPGDAQLESQLLSGNKAGGLPI